MPFEETAKLRSPDDYNLDLTKLCEKLGDCKDKILRVHFWKHEDLRVKGWDTDDKGLKVDDGGLPVVMLPETKEGD